MIKLCKVFTRKKTFGQHTKSNFKIVKNFKTFEKPMHVYIVIYVMIFRWTALKTKRKNYQDKASSRYERLAKV